MKNLTPIARSKNIVVQNLPDETLICDLNSNRVYCLNKTASEVWKLCDGKSDTIQIAKKLSQTFRPNFSEEMVLFSLNELSKENLLAQKVTTDKLFFGVSRREVIKRIGLASMIALPIITSVVMPTSANAQSGGCVADINGEFPDGCACAISANCSSTCCLAGVCGQDQAFLFNCGGGVDCPASYSCCTDFNTGVVGQFNCSCTGVC